MDTPKRKMLLPGVWLTAVQTKKFKTSFFSIHLLTPLTGEDAAPNALLPFVLRRGTNMLPDLQAVSRRLMELYGGVVEPSIRKRGNLQCIGFAASFLDDAFAGGEAVAEQAIALLGDLLLRPNTRNGRFRSEYVSSEKDNLAAMIASQRNDKRTYATQRLLEEMYSGEAPGVPRLGRAESLKKLNNLKLFQRWQSLIKSCPIELYYCGSLPFSDVERAWKEALIGLPRQGEYELPLFTPPTGPKEVRVVEEHMNVTQAKLAMGFRSGISLTSPDYPALMVMNALFGGSTNSRLFLNVREKLSLCYYAYSSTDKHTGALLVSSGVEFSNVDRAKEEILAQLDSLCRGEIPMEELSAARKSIVNELRSLHDGQSHLESFLFSQNLAGLTTTPEQLALLCSEVTAADVTRLAQTLILDTIYVLSGPEKKEEEPHD